MLILSYLWLVRPSPTRIVHQHLSGVNFFFLLFKLDSSIHIGYHSDMKPYILTLLQLLIAITMTVSATEQEYNTFATFVMCVAWSSFGFGTGICLCLWRTRKSQ